MMNLKIIRLNSNNYNRIKDISLGLVSEISAQEIFGMFDAANIFIYEYDDAIASNDSDIYLLLPVLNPYDNPLKKTINKIMILTKLFTNEAYARINEQSMFFIKDNKILEIS